jgi:hypothetical protein
MGEQMQNTPPVAPPASGALKQIQKAPPTTSPPSAALEQVQKAPQTAAPPSGTLKQIQQAEPTYFGLKRTEIETSILVPFLIAIVAAFFTVWLTRRWRDKLKVKIVSTLPAQEFEQLSALYCDRVQHFERVPPNHFRAFLKRDFSASSIRNFRRRSKRSNSPLHLTLIAKSSNGIRGFIKAIFIPEVRGLYIAYLVTSAGGDQAETAVAQQLVSKLFIACHKSAVDHIIYEICAEPKLNQQAKDRLFRHYASVYGITLHHIMAPYLQPEICSFESGDCQVTEAELYIADLNRSTFGKNRSITRREYVRLVSSIYNSVYLTSYTQAEPGLAKQYGQFLQRVQSGLFAGIKDKTIQLR